ncbi:MAG: hypothetical protein J6C55_02290 [Oscillospiraceae bacterium]|nr:hypothetical protein [Oscillospiraceae bacterium]
MIKIDLLDEVIWDWLPVIKITKYPVEQGAFRPFAQAQFCYKLNSGLFIKIIAFEVDPVNKITENNNNKIFNDSLLTVVIGNKNKNNFKYISVSFNKNNNYLIKEYQDNSFISEKLEINPVEGEDLQGIYWGGYFLITENILKKYLDFDYKINKDFYINFIKSGVYNNNFYSGGFVDIKKTWTCNLEKVFINNFNKISGGSEI